jgi:hypothetical protein
MSAKRKREEPTSWWDRLLGVFSTKAERPSDQWLEPGDADSSPSGSVTGPDTAQGASAQDLACEEQEAAA